MFNIVEYDQQWKKSELTTLANLVDLPEIGNSEIANAAADLIAGSRSGTQQLETGRNYRWDYEAGNSQYISTSTNSDELRKRITDRGLLGLNR